MMSTIATYPASTPLPVHVSDPECNAFIFPHLAMPTRGPTCTSGEHRRFPLLFWVLSPGRQWQGLPLRTEAHGTPALHDTHG